MITVWGTVQTSKFKVLSLVINYLYKTMEDKARKTSKNMRFKRSCKCFVIRLL